MDVGFDGIKIKVAIAEVAVHHNVIRNAGISRTPAHQGGIKMAMSVGDYYNNTVIGAVEGIRMGRRLESPATRYFNNLVIDVIDVGIDASEDGAQIFNNIVAGSLGFGISASGQGGRGHGQHRDRSVRCDRRETGLGRREHHRQRRSDPIAPDCSSLDTGRLFAPG